MKKGDKGRRPFGRGTPHARLDPRDPRSGLEDDVPHPRGESPETRAAFAEWLEKLQGSKSENQLSGMDVPPPDSDQKSKSNVRVGFSPEHLAILIQGREAWNKWRADNPNVTPMLSELGPRDLTGTPIWGRWEFYSQKGVGALLDEFDLSNAVMIKADLSNAFLSRANLKSAQLTNAVLTGAHINRADLRGAILQFASLSDARLWHANLNGVFAGGAILNGASLWNADLSGANLNQADLSYADLEGVSLCGARLSRADLTGAQLRRASLAPLPLPKPMSADDRTPFPQPKSTYAVSANFFGADLSDADLTATDLSYVNISNADLTGSVWTGTNVANIRYNAKELAGKCYGMAAEGMYGDATFRRDVMDQDYIDTLYRRIDAQYPTFKAETGTFWQNLQTFGRNARTYVSWLTNDLGRAAWQFSNVLPAALAMLGVWLMFPNSVPQEHMAAVFAMIPPAIIGLVTGFFFNSWYGKRGLLAFWHLMSYGRDWDRVAILAAFMIAIFGTIYSVYGQVGCGQACDASAYAFGFVDEKLPNPYHPFYPWFVASLGFATLGISDVIHPLTGFGMMIMMLNVLAGFATLGLMLAVLSDRFARRA